MKSKVMRGLGSIPTGGNIFHWIVFFHVVKPSKTSADNIGIIAILVHFKKPLVACLNISIYMHTFRLVTLMIKNPGYCLIT